MQKQFGELSQFLENKRDVELFRSSDMNNTAIYFTEVNDDERENAKAYFELLRFGLEGGDHQVYVRFPNENYFIEMLGGGMGSSHGNMMSADGKNVWGEFEKDFKIYSHDDNLILVLDDIKFSFMKKVASYDKGNPFCHPYPNETFVNYEEIKKALSMKFLKMPEQIRKIAYCYKTENSNKFIVVDFPAYNFQYENHIFRVIEGDNVKEYKIKNFQRFRDGGTTKITVIDENGQQIEFYSPQRMFKTDKQLDPSFGMSKLIEATEQERQRLISLLKLELEPKEEEVE